MDYFHEEESLGKAYDGRLMKRLLKYAYPYTGLIAFSILLLLLISATDLARPYIVKVAIDDYITSYDTPYVAVAENTGDLPIVEYGGMYLLREDHLGEENLPLLSSDQRYQIKRWDKEYLFVYGVVSPKESFELVTLSDGIFVQSSAGEFPAMRLTKEDLVLFRKKDTSSLVQLGFIFLLIVTAGFVFNYLQVFILQYTGQKIIFDLREQLFAHMEKLSISFFDSNPVGRLVTRVANDTQTLHEMYTSVLVNLFRDVFMLLGIILVMLRLNVYLALVCFAVLPLIIVVTAIFRVKARSAYRLVRVKLARINANFAENISGMRIVQIFNQESRKLQEFSHINGEHLKASMQELKVFAIFRPAMEMLYALGLALLIWFGGGEVLRGSIEFGVLFAFVNYLEQFFRPINDLTEKYNILQSAMASSERLFVILDTEPSIKEVAEPLPLGEVKGKIEFRNVWFAYNEPEWVLRDVSFVIEAGKTAAFVGATGAGKSTIINLLTRFYDIQKGQIFIDGKDIKALSKEELRSSVGLVLQDVFLFTGTIADNIRLNRKDISLSRIEEIARYVNAYTFIERLPQKLQEPVMERGATLSAGQRQLLSFARALAFDPSILILDEATANIDTETEELIQDALPRLFSNRTSIVVAHRLSTIQDADTIIVLHKGKVRESGTHQDLLKLEGLYYNLYLLQYKEELGEEAKSLAAK